MYTATCLTAQDYLKTQRNPLAVVSGEDIYIVYPNGTVEAIANDILDRLYIKKLLANCHFWGDLATF